MADISIPYWLIGLVGIIFAFVVLGVYLRFFYNNTATNNPPSQNNYGPNVGWNLTTISTGSKCQTYQFPATTKSITYNCGSTPYDGTAIEGATPSFDANIIETGNIINFQNCVDSDQLNAVLVDETCDKLFQPDNPNRRSWCFDSAGKYYEFGETASHYTSCGPQGIISDGSLFTCPGSVSGISIGFQNPGFNNVPGMKYSPSSQSDFIITDSMDLGDPTYVFRVIQSKSRTTQPSSTNGKTSGVTGPYVSIIYRSTGKCVVPRQVPPTTDMGLTLADVGPDNNNGFVWYLVPSIKFSIDVSKGCSCIIPCDGTNAGSCIQLCTNEYQNDGKKCIPCKGGEGNPPGCDNSGNCKSVIVPPGCDQNASSTDSVPQLVYIGSAPDPDKALSKKDSTAICSFLSNTDVNYTYSIRNVNNIAKLSKYLSYGRIVKKSDGKCNDDCNAYPINTAFVTYQLLNILSLSCGRWTSDSNYDNSTCS
jgi:hypothetical protein